MTRRALTFGAVHGPAWLSTPGAKARYLARIARERATQHPVIGTARVLTPVTIRVGAQAAAPAIATLPAGSSVNVVRTSLAPWDLSYGEWWLVYAPNGALGYLNAAGPTGVSTVQLTTRATSLGFVPA